jgi:hypothetical protein
MLKFFNMVEKVKVVLCRSESCGFGFSLLGKCRPCPVFAMYTLAFALQLRKKQGKTSVRVARECQLA